MTQLNQQLLASAELGPNVHQPALQDENIGRDDATWQNVGVYRNLLAAMNAPPAGKFSFLTPTGVGKVRVAVAIAEGPEGVRATITLDCVDLQNRPKIAYLIGSLSRTLDWPDACEPPAITECDLDSELTPWLSQGPATWDIDQ